MCHAARKMNNAHPSKPTTRTSHCWRAFRRSAGVLSESDVLTDRVTPTRLRCRATIIRCNWPYEDGSMAKALVWNDLVRKSAQDCEPRLDPS